MENGAKNAWFQPLGIETPGPGGRRIIKDPTLGGLGFWFGFGLRVEGFGVP